jgi:hypothetical protein
MRAIPTHRSLLAVGSLILATMSLAAPAQAQLGGLRRAAERRVEQKAEDRVQVANLIEPTFDNTTLEITSDRLDKYLVAMQRVKAQRGANQQRYEAMRAQSSALTDSANAATNERERQAFERADNTYGQCRQAVRTAAEAEQERKGEALRQRMQRDPIGAQSDPQVKQMMAVVQEIGAAQQSGDTAAVRRAQEKMTRMFGVSTDSVSLDRSATPKCGARPVKPASMVRAEAFHARADSVERESRGLNLASGAVKGAEVGMTDVQARMFWERIASWLAGMRNDAPITRTFAKAEYDILVAKRGDLRRAFSGSE